MRNDNSLKIIPVSNKREMNAFVKFNLDLYKDCPYAVPELSIDIKHTLNPKKNPAFEFSQAQPFIAKRNGKVVGRIVAIINTKANEIWKRNDVRFGWIDFIEDYEVCKALLDTCAAWGKERGMTHLQGPLGFIDFDREGALTKGYDQFSTMAMIYNYPYYIDFYRRYGLVTAASWVESIVTIPDKLPEKYVKAAKIISERYNVRIVKYTSHKKFVKEAGIPIFQLLNESYANLHGYSTLNDKQIQVTINKYLPFVDLKYIPLLYNEKNELVGCAIMIPSIAKAIKKANGKLFPFGWWHIFKALFIKQSDVMELLLIAIKPEYQKKGLNALIMTYLHETLTKYGFKRCETNAELLDNQNIQSFWNNFERNKNKYREAFEKEII